MNKMAGPVEVEIIRKVDPVGAVDVERRLAAVLVELIEDRRRSRR